MNHQENIKKRKAIVSNLISKGFKDYPTQQFDGWGWTPCLIKEDTLIIVAFDGVTIKRQRGKSPNPLAWGTDKVVDLLDFRVSEI